MARPGSAVGAAYMHMHMRMPRLAMRPGHFVRAGPRARCRECRESQELVSARLLARPLVSMRQRAGGGLSRGM